MGALSKNETKRWHSCSVFSWSIVVFVRCRAVLDIVLYLLLSCQFARVDEDQLDFLILLRSRNLVVSHSHFTQKIWGQGQGWHFTYFSLPIFFTYFFIASKAEFNVSQSTPDKAGYPSDRVFEVFLIVSQLLKCF